MNKSLRKLKTYLRFFWLPLLLAIIAILGWFYIQDNFSAFKSTLFGTLLGIGLTLATAEGFKNLTEYKRVKKTFGLLKLVTIPYIKNQADNLQETAKQYNDMCSIEQAASLFVHCAHLDRVATNFDKSWLQLIYSQDFLDSVKNDEHFNKIARAIFEVLLFLKQLSAQSINAQINLQNNLSGLSDNQKNDFIERARKMRDELVDNTTKLSKSHDELEEEIMRFFNGAGVNYSESER